MTSARAKLGKDKKTVSDGNIKPNIASEIAKHGEEIIFTKKLFWNQTIKTSIETIPPSLSLCRPAVDN